MVAPKFQPFEICEVSDPTGGLILELRANGLRLATARASADMIHDMGATRGLSRDDVRARLETSLSSLQLAPELGRQVFGYWFGPGEEIPSTPVGWPTGAVLPPPNALIQDTPAGSDIVCLDLVPVHNYWLVLSELGRHAYRHTAGLFNDEAWRFVPAKGAVGLWPVVFDAKLADPIAVPDIEALYGFEASTRARLDAPAVQLRLSRL